MATELVRRYDQVEVIDAPETAERPQGKHPFSAMFEAGFARAYGSEHRWLLTAWIAEKDEWLNAKTAISGSQSTRRTYITALDTFWMFLGADPLLVHDDRRRLAYARDLAKRQVSPDEYRHPWTVKASDAVQYRLWLEEERSVATTAHYMAVASSFFQYVIDKADIGNGGVETSLFIDAKGTVRRNPFRNRAVQRPRVNPYGKAEPLTPAAVQAFMLAIQNEPRELVRARDNALFLAYLLTGRRASEIVVMRWGDIAQGDKPGTWQFRYVGKGHGKGKREEDKEWKWQPLPTPCYNAIMGWLRLAGRLEGIEPGSFIFGPISDDGLANFGLADLDQNRHVAARRVGQLMDKVGKRAGLGKLHPHQLRHTFASQLYKSSGGDIRLVAELLGHKHYSTTQIYLEAMERKEDTYSEKLIAQLGLNL